MRWDRDAGFDAVEKIIDLIFVVATFSPRRLRESDGVHLLRGEATAARRCAHSAGGGPLGKLAFEISDALFRVVLRHRKMIAPARCDRSSLVNSRHLFGFRPTALGVAAEHIGGRFRASAHTFGHPLLRRTEFRQRSHREVNPVDHTPYRGLAKGPLDRIGVLVETSPSPRPNVAMCHVSPSR